MRAAVTGCLLALAIAGPAAAAQQQVLYVGDSLGVGTTPLLSRALGSSARVHGDSRIGRPSGEGLRVLQQTLNPSDQIVVFDLGTNDDPAAPRTLAADLAAARRATADRCLIVATLNRPPLNGVSVDGLNQAVLAFASGAKNVQLVDWNAIAQSEPSLLGPDHVHPTPQGYALRAQLFSEAIDACSAPASDETDSLASPAPEPKRKPKRRTRQRHVKVPGIESSGISFSEPVRCGATSGQLLLPNTKPPYPAVVMLRAAQAESEFFAAHGLAALVCRGAGVRAAVTVLAKRDDIRHTGIAVWGFGESPARAAAGNRDVAAVVAMSPSAIPHDALRDWRARRSTDAPAITTWLRVRGDSDDAADLWKRVAQPVLAIWGTRDAQMPIRDSADALRRALAAGPNRDRTFRWFDATDTGAIASKDGEPVFAPGLLEETARWLGLHLGERRAKPVVNDASPPANAGPKANDLTSASVIYSQPLQAIWLLAPALLLAAAARRARLALVPLALGIACAAATAAGIAMVLDSGSVNELAGTPWPFALAFVFAAALLACSAAAAIRRAWLVTIACDVWLALALFWLL